MSDRPIVHKNSGLGFTRCGRRWDDHPTILVSFLAKPRRFRWCRVCT